MKKVLTILGTTASGKTSLALKIKSKLDSKLISADSRQIYKGMDIVTGKDHPRDVRIDCIDTVYPDQKFSVSSWNKLAVYSIEEAWEAGKLPIIVGGTGLYITSLTNEIETLNIPPDHNLRNELAKKSVVDLQNILRSLEPNKLKSMNNSDIHNDRRLIRAIEVAKWGSNNPTSTHVDADYLHIVLIPSDMDLHKKLIQKRVISRLKMGAVKETKDLLKKYDATLPSFSAVGYKHIIDYIEGRIDKNELIENWTQEEFRYAKRQIVWFKKMKNTKIFDPQDKSNISDIVKLANNWYIRG